METAQVLGCDDVKCAVSIAKAAKADLVVYGSIEEIDGAHTFSLTLTDPERHKCSAAKMLSGARTLQHG